MKRRVIFVIASVVLVVGLLLAGFGCAGEAPPTEGPPTEGPPTEGPPTEGPPEVKTLKIGMLESLNWPIGTDCVDVVQLDVDRTNAEGGLLIGGERYKLELIVDDIKMDLALAKTAAEKQIFQDEVKFIKGGIYCTSYLDLAEEEKVVVVATPTTEEIMDPKYHYCFSGNQGVTSWVSIINWVADQMPDKKTIVFAFPDRYDGHAYQPIWEAAAEGAGLTTLESLFYPVPSTDVSATATRTKTLNPDFLVPFGGGPDMDSLVMKACYVAGWKGQIFDTANIPGGYFLAIAGPEASEGLIAGAWPTEFEPALTEMAREFKADWIAKYGEWTDPEPATVSNWWILKAALQKASSPDPDEVAAIIGGGLEFECPYGQAMMVSRPDLGNPRTVHVIFDVNMKQLVEGEIQQIGYISTQEVYEYCKLTYGW